MTDDVRLAMYDLPRLCLLTNKNLKKIRMHSNQMCAAYLSLCRLVNRDQDHYTKNARLFKKPVSLEQGYLVLHDVLTEAEIVTLDPRFEHFVTGKVPNMGRDFFYRR